MENNIIDIEKSILSSILRNEKDIPYIISNLKAEYFDNEFHSHIYDVIIYLFENNIKIDLLSIIQQLKKENKLINGGINYLSSLLDNIALSSYVAKYIEILKSKFIKNQIINIANKMIDKALDENVESMDILNETYEELSSISKKSINYKLDLLKDFTISTIDHIEEIRSNKNKMIGISSGYTMLDKLTSGFKKTDLIILAARPGMGKTTLALNFSLNVAFNKKTVAIFSLEMSKEQLALKLFSNNGKIDIGNLSCGNLNDQEYKNLANSIGSLSELSIYVDDSSFISPLELKSKLLVLKNSINPDLVIIDYLQLIKGSKKKYDNRFQEVSEVVRELKGVAKDLNLPIIALSQLSRSVEQRADNIPKLSDLRETGEIEQTADIVMFINRTDYYNHNDETNSIATIYIEKNRMGSLGNFDLIFRKNISKFDEFLNGDKSNG